ncbi:MAG: hypothetical protein H6719_16960 [Sandaracinaceae bacterium]|nr:hypothetical protein [Sandaracinaceae bacterium]
MRVRTTSLLLLTVLAWSPAAPTLAQSDATRAILLTFEGGRRGDAARDAALAELASHVELVTEDQAIATAETMGVDVSSPQGLAEVVRELRVTLVVMGAVRGSGRRGRTEIVVVDPDGVELARVEAPAPGGAASRAEIGRLAVEAVDNANAALAAREQVAEPEPEAPAVAAPIVYDDEGDDDEDQASTREGWRQPLVIALVGLRLRTLSTSVDEEATNTRFFFEADMYPEIELVTWFRPLTDADDELARGLLLGVRGSFSAGIRYIDASTGEERGMTSFRFRADVGYAYTIENIVEIAGMVGFGMDGLDLEGPTTSFPSTLFSYVRPGLGLRVALYETLFVLDGGIGGRIGVDGGAIAGAFGPGLFFGGVDLSIGFSGIVAPGFAWAARFGYVFHSLSFDGAGGPFGDGSGGQDEALELRLLVGAAF